MEIGIEMDDFHHGDHFHYYHYVSEIHVDVYGFHHDHENVYELSH